jgi:hypothetical protein
MRKVDRWPLRLATLSGLALVPFLSTVAVSDTLHLPFMDDEVPCVPLVSAERWNERIPFGLAMTGGILTCPTSRLDTWSR